MRSETPSNRRSPPSITRRRTGLHQLRAPESAAANLQRGVDGFEIAAWRRRLDRRVFQRDAFLPTAAAFEPLLHPSAVSQNPAHRL
ncbi:MAG: hypothetical protein R3F11_28860 [Verrucomicrobiales bacterium]